jgi:pyruvate/2-oxoglutarate dehydrogenase complex dihydrolipoamide acyltransferase (E2) component
VLYVHPRTSKRGTATVATDYDELRPDVKESQANTLEAFQSAAAAPDARSVALELDESEALDDASVPGGEIIAEELIIHVQPQAKDEFTCHSCFLVRHRSQIAREKAGHAYCFECEA